MNREDHNTPQHTPTFRIQAINGVFYIRPNQADDRSQPVALCHQRSDAELIVRAVNRDHAFEPMRKALIGAERIERLYAERSENCARVNARQGTVESLALSRQRLDQINIELRAIRESIRASLALAEKE